VYFHVSTPSHLFPLILLYFPYLLFTTLPTPYLPLSISPVLSHLLPILFSFSFLLFSSAAYFPKLATSLNNFPSPFHFDFYKIREINILF
jgi:hypothetical protein